MKYPKMLYKGESKNYDNEQLRNDLLNKVLRTFIVANEDQEIEKREEGYVDLHELIPSPEEKIRRGRPPKLKFTEISEPEQSNVGTHST